jgi:hypothetical protein
MGHVICSVKTGLNQSIVKLNLFNNLEKKNEQSYTKQIRKGS